MPKVRRESLPPGLFQHLLDRVAAREITGEQIEALARWLDNDPDVPDGEWFKVLSKVVVCGEGPLIKTFLRAGQAPRGKRL